MKKLQSVGHNFQPAKTVPGRGGYRKMILAFELDELEERRKGSGLPKDWRDRILK